MTKKNININIPNIDKIRELRRSRRKNHLKFPLLGFLLLVVGILWLLNDLQVINIQVQNLSWWPIIIILVSLGIISKRLKIS